MARALFIAHKKVSAAQEIATVSESHIAFTGTVFMVAEMSIIKDDL